MLGRAVLLALGSLLLAGCTNDVAAPARRTIELVPRGPGTEQPPLGIDLRGRSGVQLLPRATEEPRATNL